MHILKNSQKDRQHGAGTYPETGKRKTTVPPNDKTCAPPVLTFQCQIPSKTFVFGEYLTLHGGPALLLATDPPFIFTAHYDHKSRIDGIPAGSPAAIYRDRYAEDFIGWSMTLDDPHQGQGGFGASSAQFVGIYAMHAYITGISQHAKGIPTRVACDGSASMEAAIKIQAEQGFETLRKDYRNCAWEGFGYPPSGVDVSCQYAHLRQAGLSPMPSTFFWHQKAGEKASFYLQAWPFTDMRYRLLRTGKKIATHTHLKLALSFDANRLYDIACIASEHFQHGNRSGFCKAVMDYHTALEADGLVHPHTQKLLKRLHQDPDVLAAKGCGALGADVILILERGVPVK